MAAEQTRQEPALRDYTAEEIAQFIRDDELDETARTIAQRFSAVMDGQTLQKRSPNGPGPK